MIGVIGYSRSGKAVASLIKRLGETPFISEKSEDFPDIPYPHEMGCHSEELLKMDMLIVSPGISLHIPILKEAKELGIPIIGELEFASRYLKGRIVAVTGTNGKTTTAALTSHILSRSERFRKILLGGNIYPGTPLSELVPESSKATITVLEVSSFQLERIQDFCPYVAIITNISPDHLNRYNDFNEYRDAKFNIFKNQTNCDYSILNLDDDNLSSLKVPSKSLYFSMKERTDIYFNEKEVKVRDNKVVFSPDDLSLPGSIFIEDGMAASLVAEIFELPWGEVRMGIRSFRGVEHRMETILKRKDIHIINNSMCTNPVAFARSLEAFPESCVIVGGRIKVIDITPVIEAIQEWAARVILLGESSDTIGERLNEVGFHRYRIASSMKEAVQIAKDRGNRRVMLSPGGSSFDLYIDFTERGKDFRKAVRAIYGE